MLLPFSLFEARELVPDLTLQEYMRFGGFPGVVPFSNDRMKLTQLTDLTDSILFKDILLRGQVANPLALRNLTAYLLDTVGRRSSVRRITNTLGSLTGENTRQETIAKYLAALKEAFLFYEVQRYDLRGKAILGREPKYYAVDPGIRTALAGNSDGSNLGSTLENLVYLQLLRTEHQVYVGHMREGEIDFVALRDGQRVYIQVALTALDEDTARREFGALMQMRDHYPRFLLTTDNLDLSREGIRHMNVERFLMGEELA